jgi:uncharacterized delta-60 repeat protein
MKFNRILKALVFQLLYCSYAVGTIPNAYVTTGSSITIVNTSTNTITGTISLASSGATDLFLIAVLPNNEYLYCVDHSNNHIYVVNLATQTLTAQISSGIGTGTTAIAVSANGQFVYVTYRTGNTFSVVNTSTNTATNYTTLSSTFVGINYVVASPDGNYIYLTDAFSNKVAIISTSNYSALVNTFTVGTGGQIGGIAMPTNSSSIAYVANYVDGKVYPVTGLPGSPAVGTGITVAPNPVPLIMNPANNNTVFVANIPGSGATSMNAITNITTSPTVTTYTLAATPLGCSSLAATPDGSEVYASLPSQPAVIVVNILTNTTSTISASVTGWLAVGSLASGILDTTFGNQGITLTPISRSDQVFQSVINSNNATIITGITQTFGGTPPTLLASVLLARYTSSGLLDTTFNSSGSTPGIQTLLVGSRSEGYGVGLDANSKILVAGMCVQNNQTDMLLARYLSTGAIDTSFNTVGYNTQAIGSGAIANAVGVQSAAQSNKIIIAGCSVNGGSPNFTLARYTTAGALDTTFGSNGITTTSIGNSSLIATMAIIPSGGNTDYIVAVGNADNNIAVARYTNTTGALDTSFGTGGIFNLSIAGASSTKAYDVALDSSNNIVIAGSAYISGIYQSLLVRLTPSGALDTTFNSTGYVTQKISGGSEFYSVTIQPNNSIVAGGYAISPLTNQISMTRFLSNGSLDPSYGSSGITLTTDGNIAYAASLGLQSSTLNCVAAGMADGTVSIERYTS